MNHISSINSKIIINDKITLYSTQWPIPSHECNLIYFYECTTGYINTCNFTLWTIHESMENKGMTWITITLKWLAITLNTVQGRSLFLRHLGRRISALIEIRHCYYIYIKTQLESGFSRIKMYKKINVMDKIWDRKSFEVGGHWPLWRGWKNRMTTQNRHKSNAKKVFARVFPHMSTVSMVSGDFPHYV